MGSDEELKEVRAKFEAYYHEIGIERDAAGEYTDAVTWGDWLAFRRGFEAAQTTIPQGFRVTHNPDWSALTAEANAMTRWSVERTTAPFCGDDGRRLWSGPTLNVALQDAIKALQEST